MLLSNGSADEAFPSPPLVQPTLSQCAAWWREWISHHNYRGPWEEPVKRSLITLKALTYETTSGMVRSEERRVGEESTSGDPKGTLKNNSKQNKNTQNKS